MEGEEGLETMSADNILKNFWCKSKERNGNWTEKLEKMREIIA